MQNCCIFKNEMKRCFSTENWFRNLESFIYGVGIICKVSSTSSRLIELERNSKEVWAAGKLFRNQNKRIKRSTTQYSWGWKYNSMIESRESFRQKEYLQIRKWMWVTDVTKYWNVSMSFWHSLLMILYTRGWQLIILSCSDVISPWPEFFWVLYMIKKYIDWR